MKTCVTIGLGSNLECPETQLNEAISALKQNSQIQNLAISDFYRSKPVGPVKQPDFINAVARFETELPPLELLDLLQSIEVQHGRERLIHWGPRTLDLDILLYGDLTIVTPRLTVPHAQMHLRAFVLIPLQNLAPEIVLPNGESLHNLIAQLPAEDIKNLHAMNPR